MCSATKKNRRKLLLKATKRHKKSSPSKNCFVYQNSKNDNSIRLPSGEEKPPKVPFNGLSLLAFQAQRKLSYFEPTINETLADLAEHYETTILPARSYKPRDKSLVEGAVKI
ncbi:MAG: hypothetical protein KA208_08940, partial [Flavobacterium sp.]|nr:hypothetical protein [Flavobacterium sp.]